MRLIACVLLAAVMVAGCGDGDDGTPTSPSPSANVPFSTTDLRVGTGLEATLGRAALVNYTGWLYSTTAADNKGTRFDSSLDPGRQPLVIQSLGSGLIQGFSRGVQGMRVGGLRRVVIPPDLGYGAAGSPPAIPGNATLIFEIELLAVQ
jgi:FKBP-type peptidyl-prolyl cis-trans isomerase FkpA